MAGRIVRRGCLAGDEVTFTPDYAEGCLVFEGKAGGAALTFQYVCAPEEKCRLITRLPVRGAGDVKAVIMDHDLDEGSLTPSYEVEGRRSGGPQHRRISDGQEWLAAVERYKAFMASLPGFCYLQPTGAAAARVDAVASSLEDEPQIIFNKMAALARQQTRTPEPGTLGDPRQFQRESPGT